MSDKLLKIYNAYFHTFHDVDDDVKGAHKSVRYYVATDQGTFLGLGFSKREAVVDAVRGIREYLEHVNQ